MSQIRHAYNNIITVTLGFFSLILLYTFYLAANDVCQTISPQGCRMSWMSPSYLLQREFNSSWTPLASRYSLWLYREVGWESNQPLGMPVLFIPGNAGSSRQVRSIASSAARQYFSSPSIISSDFVGREIKSLDFFAAEFNEDLSAFHGPTLDSQIEYSSAAIRYILSHYPPHTPILVMGHSMGGIVGTALLPSNDISALITMSTPHTLPPARFDARVDEIYRRNARLLENAPTPIVSICGGATDMMIPSESCILTDVENGVYRRTVFTSALEGAWTGVGHREMVWCHQVRWRIARAALELGGARSNTDMTSVLDRWLNGDSHHFSPAIAVGISDAATYETLPEDMNLVLDKPTGFRVYLLPIRHTVDANTTFVMYVSRGSISSIVPQRMTKLQVSPYVCHGRATSPTTQQHPRPLSCIPLEPSNLRLLPSPIPGKPFPVPDEGADESEGVVLFEAVLPHTPLDAGDAWIGIQVNATGEDGWVLGGFDKSQVVLSDISTFNVLAGDAKFSLQPANQTLVRRHVTLPKLLSNSLLVYTLTSRSDDLTSSHADHLMPPLLMHRSHPAETHYYRLEHDRPIALHTHASGPYIPLSRFSLTYCTELWIYPSGIASQDMSEFSLTIDWWATVGRIGIRYITTLVCWSIGVVALLMFYAWRESRSGPMPSVQQSLVSFIRGPMLKYLAVSFVVALFPLGPKYYLGTQGEPFFALLAPAILVLATGLVSISWWLTLVIIWPFRLLGQLMPMNIRSYDNPGMSRNTIASMIFISLLVMLFIPWQIAFIGCYLIHLHTCTSSSNPKPYPGSVPTIRSTPTESLCLREHSGSRDDMQEVEPSEVPGVQDMHLNQDFTVVFDAWDADQAYHESMYILLLMTWLLPLSMPVLAVWVRTLMTAGYTTPFNGDHNVFKVAPFLVLVDCAGRRRSPLLSHGNAGSYVHWGCLIVACVSFLLGSREAYRVLDATNLYITCTFFARFYPRRKYG